MELENEMGNEMKWSNELSNIYTFTKFFVSSSIRSGVFPTASRVERMALIFAWRIWNTCFSMSV